MLFVPLALATITFAQTKAAIVQTELDRAGFSCNTIDGVWGGKSARAESAYAAAHGLPPAATAEDAYRAHFRNRGSPYRWDTVTAEDLAALVAIPADPAAKQELAAMGYEAVKEMFAERGHVSTRALERLNPQIADWSRVRAGDRIRIPDFPSMDEELDAWPRNRPGAPQRPVADLVRISISRFEVTVYDKSGKLLALFRIRLAIDKDFFRILCLFALRFLVKEVRRGHPLAGGRRLCGRADSAARVRGLCGLLRLVAGAHRGAVRRAGGAGVSGDDD